MKILFYTDLHLTAKRPIHRIDDFQQSQMNKLREVYDIAKQNKVDCVLFGGDFFNNHRIFSYELIISAIDILFDSKIMTYGVVGQHDLVGYNKDTFKTSTLYFSERYCQNYKTLWEPLTLNGVTIYPCHWFDDARKMAKQKLSGDSILLAHQSVVKEAVPFNAILTSELQGDFDLILSGDIHGGFAAHKIGKTTFYNCGSLTRLAINDYQRHPKVGLIEINNGKIKIKEFKLQKALESDKVFGTSVLEEVRVAAESLNTERFIEGILELEQEAVNLFDLVQKIANSKGVDKEIIDYILSKRK